MMEEIKLKEINYKGKIKHIPEKNIDGLCQFFIIAKMRYCKFEKFENSNFCVYHLDDEKTFIPCPYDPSHKILVSSYKKHLKVCNKLTYAKNLELNPWYVKSINNQLFDLNDDILKLYDLKWEELDEMEYSITLDKIIEVYQITKDQYSMYLKDNLHILNKFREDNNLDVTISGLIVEDKDLESTKQLIKSEKNNLQNEAITNVIERVNLLKKNNIFIEFGAGRGGLSYHINSKTNDDTIHILLEREGVRYKRDKFSDKMIRFRTDILDFNINYLDKFVSEKYNNLIDYEIIGIAKHICGCALDISLNCLLNYANKDKIKGIIMATCCHHLSKLEYLTNYDFYTNKLGLSNREIVLLFKSSSWIFGAIDLNNENLKSNKIFEQKSIKKKYIGCISKYIIDICRCLSLVNKGFKAFYVKYCNNEITTENNLLLAIK